MIEQVLYRRTLQGYSEFNSKGLTKEQAHNVNVVMNTAITKMKDLGSGADFPFMIYPFPEMQKVCIAIFQREFSKGRGNSVNHAILIPWDEYQELKKNPENIWGFTYKNFLSKKENHRGEMISLKHLDTVENPELNKEVIFQEYHLNNPGFLKFLTAIYTSLGKNKKYTCGIEVDNAKDFNKVMRHFGYLIMSMLPFELRDQISFCSRSVPDTMKITVQVISEDNLSQPDVVYNLNSEECKVHSKYVEITDFYLNDLMNMTDSSLKSYFSILDEFKNNLKLSENSEAQYVVTKLLKLSQKPELFQSETAENQLAFINDVFSLSTEETDIINPIVVTLLPYVDPQRHMEVFQINFGLYRKLDLEKEMDKKILPQIEYNLLQNYRNSTPEEKIELYQSVFNTDDSHISLYHLMIEFMDVNDIQIDKQLAEIYVSLYEKLYDTEWREKLYWKIENIFRNGDISDKDKIWERLYKGTNKTASTCFMYNILKEKDEPFQKSVFYMLVALFQETSNSKIKERYYSRIMDVVEQEDDQYRLKILRQYKDASKELENTLWIDTYNSIKDYRNVIEDPVIMQYLNERFCDGSHSKVCDLYLDYIEFLPVKDLENIIHDIEQKSVRREREIKLLSAVISALVKKKQKVLLEALKGLISSAGNDNGNELAAYIRELYLSDDTENSLEIYSYLEKECPRIYNNLNLQKENLPSFDSYCAENLNRNILNDRQRLYQRLKYLEQLKYNQKSYDKIFSLYRSYIKKEFVKIKTDYDRYLKSRDILNQLSAIDATQFGASYKAALEDKVRECFWNDSNESTFTYKYCDIYTRNSDVFSAKYANHENHILAENIKGLINGRYVDWDKVYKMLLSKEYIPKDNLRIHISKDFITQYRNRGFNISQPEYIAFECVNKNNLKMDYTALFENLQKCGYPINSKSIADLHIFSYIPVSRQLRKKISNYKNYQSIHPSYKDIITGLLIEQVAVFVMLLINNITRFFALKQIGNGDGYNTKLFLNYAGYEILIIVVVAVTILLMIRANRRKSFCYDTDVFILLIANLVLTVFAIIFSIRFTWLLLDIFIPVIIMATVILLNRKSRDVIGSPSGDMSGRGGNIYD